MKKLIKILGFSIGVPALIFLAYTVVYFSIHPDQSPLRESHMSSLSPEEHQQLEDYLSFYYSTQQDIGYAEFKSRLQSPE